MIDGALQTGEAGPETFQIETLAAQSEGEDKSAQHAVEGQMSKTSLFCRLLDEAGGNYPLALQRAVAIIWDQAADVSCGYVRAIPRRPVRDLKDPPPDAVDIPPPTEAGPL